MFPSGAPCSVTTFGWPSLDDATGGARPGRLGAWIGPPGSGMSYLLAWSALAAHEQGRKVHLVSTEMGVLSMARRLIGIKTRINPNLIKSGTLSTWGERIIHDGIKELRGGAPFILWSCRPAECAATIDALAKEYSPDVVYVDAKPFLVSSHRREDVKRVELLHQIAIARNISIQHTIPCSCQQGACPYLALGKIGAKEAIEQTSSVVITVEEGKPGNESTTRTLSIVANREGPLASVTINFLFNPINFSEIQLPAAIDAWMA